MPEIRIEATSRSVDLWRSGPRSQEHESPRTSSSPPPRRSSRPQSLSGSWPRLAGGGVVALVTADLESHLVAVDANSGRVVRRIRRLAGPRSIERHGFGQALVAHTAFGRVSVVDAATLRVIGEVAGLGEPRYAAMHPSERLAYVSDSKRGAVVVIDLARVRLVGRVGRSRSGASPLAER